MHEDFGFFNNRHVTQIGLLKRCAAVDAVINICIPVVGRLVIERGAWGSIEQPMVDVSSPHLSSTGSREYELFRLTDLIAYSCTTSPQYNDIQECALSEFDCVYKLGAIGNASRDGGSGSSGLCGSTSTLCCANKDRPDDGLLPQRACCPTPKVLQPPWSALPKCWPGVRNGAQDRSRHCAQSHSDSLSCDFLGNATPSYDVYTLVSEDIC